MRSFFFKLSHTGESLDHCPACGVGKMPLTEYLAPLASALTYGARQSHIIDNGLGDE